MHVALGADMVLLAWWLTLAYTQRFLFRSGTIAELFLIRSFADNTISPVHQGRAHMFASS